MKIDHLQVRERGIEREREMNLGSLCGDDFRHLGDLDLISHLTAWVLGTSRVFFNYFSSVVEITTQYQEEEEEEEESARNPEPLDPRLEHNKVNPNLKLVDKLYLKKTWV